MAAFQSDHLCWKALAISLVLHGLLLSIAWRLVWDAGNGTAPLHALLRPAVPVREAASSTTPAPRKSAPAAERKTAKKWTGQSADRSETSATSGEGLDAEGLRGYRVGLAAAARPFFRSPATARWRGSLEARVTVTAAGLTLTPELVRSSGQPAMDQAALEMLRRAAATTPLPDSLRGHSFAVSLPMEFAPAD